MSQATVAIQTIIGEVSAPAHAVHGIWAATPAFTTYKDPDGAFVKRGAHVVTHLPTGHRVIQLTRKDWACSAARSLHEQLPQSSIADTTKVDQKVRAAVEAALYRWGEGAGVEVLSTPWGFVADKPYPPTEGDT